MRHPMELGTEAQAERKAVTLGEAVEENIWVSLGRKKRGR